jgi:hypothetical protein
MPARLGHRRPRDAYADASTAARESIARTISWATAHPHQKQVSRNMRVLLAVHLLTACYSRVADRVYVAQVAKVAELPTCSRRKPSNGRPPPSRPPKRQKTKR